MCRYIDVSNSRRNSRDFSDGIICSITTEKGDGWLGE